MNPPPAITMSTSSFFIHSSTSRPILAESYRVGGTLTANLTVLPVDLITLSILSFAFFIKSVARCLLS